MYERCQTIIKYTKYRKVNEIKITKNVVSTFQTTLVLLTLVVIMIKGVVFMCVNASHVLYMFQSVTCDHGLGHIKLRNVT